jgi:hypothetical protein
MSCVVQVLGWLGEAAWTETKQGMHSPWNIQNKNIWQDRSQQVSFLCVEMLKVAYLESFNLICDLCVVWLIQVRRSCLTYCDLCYFGWQFSQFVLTKNHYFEMFIFSNMNVKLMIILYLQNVFYFSSSFQFGNLFWNYNVKIKSILMSLCSVKQSETFLGIGSLACKLCSGEQVFPFVS